MLLVFLLDVLSLLEGPGEGRDYVERTRQGACAGPNVA